MHGEMQCTYLCEVWVGGGRNNAHISEAWVGGDTMHLLVKPGLMHLSVWSLGWWRYNAPICVKHGLGGETMHISVKSGIGEIQCTYPCEVWVGGDAMHLSVWSLGWGRCNAPIRVKSGLREMQCTYQCEVWVGGDAMHLSVWSLGWGRCNALINVKTWLREMQCTHVWNPPSLGRYNAYICVKPGLGEIQCTYLCEVGAGGETMHLSVWSLGWGRYNAPISEAWVGGDTIHLLVKPGLMHLSMWSLGCGRYNAPISVKPELGWDTMHTWDGGLSKYSYQCCNQEPLVSTFSSALVSIIGWTTSPSVVKQPLVSTY